MGNRIRVLGDATCEDTALVVDRLRAVGVVHEYVDIDLDAAAHADVLRLNDGHRITPTVIVGAEEVVVAEPSLEHLGGVLDAAGHSGTKPVATQLHGPIIGRSIPVRTVSTVEGPSFSLDALRGRRPAALLLAHGPQCLACLGYARQLSAQREAMNDAGASSIVVVGGEASEAGDWATVLAPPTVLVADPGAAWKVAIARDLSLATDRALLVLLDRYAAPRVVSHSSDAGGLIDPSEAADWLRFLELECPECSGEIEWPEDTLAT